MLIRFMGLIVLCIGLLGLSGHTADAALHEMQSIRTETAFLSRELAERRFFVTDLNQQCCKPTLPSLSRTWETIVSKNHECRTANPGRDFALFFVSFVVIFDSFQEVPARDRKEWLFRKLVSWEKYAPEILKCRVQSSSTFGLFAPIRRSIDQIDKHTPSIGHVDCWRFAYVFERYFDNRIDIFGVEDQFANNFSLNCNPSSICLNQCSFRNFRSFSCCLSGILSHLNGRLHVAGLTSSSLSRQSNLLLASNPEQNSGDTQASRKNDQPESKERYRVSRSPLPEGFAFLCLMGAVFGGLVAFLFFLFSRRIS